MADLKLRTKVTLKAGETIYAIGTVFEGTLDTFPEDIRADYLAKRWDILEVLVTAKGTPVPAQLLPVNKGESTRPSSSTFHSEKSVSVEPGVPVPSPSSVETSFESNDSDSIVQSDKKKPQRKKKEDTGERGLSTNVLKSNTVLASKKKIEGLRSKLIKK
jgi:hypothetical protein